MMQEVEVLKTIQELICSFFSEEQFTLSNNKKQLTEWKCNDKIIKCAAQRGFVKCRKCFRIPKLASNDKEVQRCTQLLQQVESSTK